MIINIRGTNGSGKTHLVKRLIASHEMDDVVEDGKIIGHLLNGKLYVVGMYTKHGAHGGADTIKTSDEICRRIREFSKYGNVIFEGVIVSTVYQRWADLSEEIDQAWLWLCLNTSLEQCHNNISYRNFCMSYNKKLVDEKYKTVLRTAERAEEAGKWVLPLSNDDAFNRIEEWMRNWSVFPGYKIKF